MWPLSFIGLDFWSIILWHDTGGRAVSPEHVGLPARIYTGCYQLFFVQGRSRQTGSSKVYEKCGLNLEKQAIKIPLAFMSTTVFFVFIKYTAGGEREIKDSHFLFVLIQVYMTVEPQILHYRPTDEFLFVQRLLKMWNYMCRHSLHKGAFLSAKFTMC